MRNITTEDITKIINAINDLDLPQYKYQKEIAEAKAEIAHGFTFLKEMNELYKRELSELNMI